MPRNGDVPAQVNIVHLGRAQFGPPRDISSAHAPASRRQELPVTLSNPAHLQPDNQQQHANQQMLRPQRNPGRQQATLRSTSPTFSLTQQDKPHTAPINAVCPRPNSPGWQRAQQQLHQSLSPSNGSGPPSASSWTSRPDVLGGLSSGAQQRDTYSSSSGPGSIYNWQQQQQWQLTSLDGHHQHQQQEQQEQDLLCQLGRGKGVPHVVCPFMYGAAGATAAAAYGHFGSYCRPSPRLRKNKNTRMIPPSGRISSLSIHSAAAAALGAGCGAGTIQAAVKTTQRQEEEVPEGRSLWGASVLTDTDILDHMLDELIVSDQQVHYGRENMSTFQIETYTPSRDELQITEVPLPYPDRNGTTNRDTTYADHTFLTSCKVPTSGSVQQQQEEHQVAETESWQLATTSTSAAAAGRGGASRGLVTFTTPNTMAGSFMQGASRSGYSSTTHHAAAAASMPLWLRGEGVLGSRDRHGQSHWQSLPPMGLACSTDLCFHGKQGRGSTATPGDGGIVNKQGALQEHSGVDGGAVARLQLLPGNSGRWGVGGAPREWGQVEEAAGGCGEDLGGAPAPDAFKGIARPSKGALPSYQDLVKQMHGMHKLYTCGTERQPTSNMRGSFTGGSTVARAGQPLSAAEGAPPNRRSSSPRNCAEGLTGAEGYRGDWPNLDALIDPKARMSSGSGAECRSSVTWKSCQPRYKLGVSSNCGQS